RANPFARMFRVGKLTLAALEATLTHFVNADHAEALPFYRMLARPLAELQARAEELTERLPHGRAHVEDDLSYIGSGSIPDEGIPTRVVCVRAPGISPATLARRCREQLPALFARIRDDALVCDLRTVAEDELAPLAAGLRAALMG
ncbi:MAG: L-seryl-tRNA(Sec) selenium transferase, partial [Planctomycetota bacterium]